jgi:hypothetical protein
MRLSNVEISKREYLDHLVVDFKVGDVIYANGVPLSELRSPNLILQVFVYKRLVQPFLDASKLRHTMDELHEFNTKVSNEVTL